MHNIEQYGDDYNSSNTFEVIQVKYRKKVVLNCLDSAPLPPPPPLTILEIGCGMEPLFLYYGDYAQYALVEPCTVFFDNAEKLKQEKQLKNISCYHNFFEDAVVHLQHYAFDYIICSSLLHEVEQPTEFLKSIFNLCIKDKTTVHINVPNMYSFHRLWAKESGLIKDEHDVSDKNILLQQHTNFDMKMLVAMAEETGFKVINKGSYFIKPFTHEQMNQLLNIGILNQNLLDGLYNMQKYMPDMGSEIFVELRK